MTIREMHPQFDDTFLHYDSVPHQIRVGLWNYLAYGIPAGGFCMQVLNNNFMGAMGSADSSWNGRSFKDLALWITWYAPSESFGSDEKIRNWVKKTDLERREIMIELKLRPSVIDILKGDAIA